MRRLSAHLFPVLLLLAFCAVYVPHLSRTITLDEAYTMRHYALSPIYALGSYTAPNNHMLHSLAVWFSTTLLGDSLVGVRLPALVFGLLTLATAWRIGRRTAGTSAALLALAGAGAASLALEYMVTARGYSLSYWLVLLLVDLLVLTPIYRVSRYGVLATTSALVLTLPHMTIVVAGCLVWLALQRRRAARALILPLVVGTLIAALFYLAPVLVGQLDEFRTGFGASEYVREPLTLLSDIASSLVVYGLLGIPAAGVVVIAGFILLATARAQAVRRFAVWLAVQLAVTFALSFFQFLVVGWVFYLRQYLYLYILLLVAAALGLGMWAAHYTAGRWAVRLAAVLCVALAWVNLAPSRQPTLVDAALAHIARHVAPDEAVLLGCCIGEPLWYQLHQQGDDALLFVTPATRRVYLLAEVDPPLILPARYGLPVTADECPPVRDEDWSPLTVYACPLPASSAPQEE